MKNTKLNIRKLANSGFSLAGFISLITISCILIALGIGALSAKKERELRARQDAMQVVLVFNRALDAGYKPPAGLTVAEAYDAVHHGIAVKNTEFRVPDLPGAGGERDDITQRICWGDNRHLEWLPK